MSNKIRRVLIGAEPKSQFVYFVGGEFPLFVDQKKVVVTVNDIEETEKHFLIYVNTGGEIQLWKKIPKNDSTTVEFFID